MKFGTVRIHFLGEDFAAVAVEVASFFVCLFVCLFPARHLLVIVLNCMLILFASYFHEQLVSILFLFRMLGMERSLFSPVMTTTMIQKAKI